MVSVLAPVRVSVAEQHPWSLTPAITRRTAEFSSLGIPSVVKVEEMTPCNPR